MHPQYLKLMKYLYNLLQNILSTDLWFIQGKQNIFMQEDRDTYLTKCKLSLFIWFAFCFCCAILSLTLVISFTLAIFHLSSSLTCEFSLNFLHLSLSICSLTLWIFFYRFLLWPVTVNHTIFPKLLHLEVWFLPSSFKSHLPQYTW